MSREQIKRSQVIQNYIEGTIDRKQAAQGIGLSERQVSRIAERMKKEGTVALIHKNTNRKPKHALSKETKEKIVTLKKTEKYRNSNIMHFQELLEREHGIKVSYKAVYNTLKEAQITSPKKHRKTRSHHRRKRKACAGELLQIDATPFEWFGGNKKYALHAAIDDATGAITGAYITENECLFGYMEVMRQTFIRCGYPLSVYSDKHTIFRSPKTATQEEKGEEANLTQFGRAMSEVGVNVIHAHSPQAKGRIERLWVTLQSRLPIEIGLNQITTVEEANAFLKDKYIAMFNERFRVEAEGEPMFVTCNDPSALDDILCIKEDRKTDNVGVFSYNGNKFKVIDDGYPLIPAKAKIKVLISTQNSVRVQYNGRYFATIHVPSEKKERVSGNPKASVDVVASHLKHGSDAWKTVWHYESYEQSLAFIYSLFFKPLIITGSSL